MAKKFNLQTVLKYRQSLEDQAQQQLAGSLQRKSQLEKELQEHRSVLQQLDAELKVQQQEGLTVADINLFEGQIQHRRRLIADLGKLLEQLAGQINAEREELLQAAREKKVMEKLKTKQEAEYMQELSRKERIVLDEVSLRGKGNKS